MKELSDIFWHLPEEKRAGLSYRNMQKWIFGIRVDAWMRALLCLSFISLCLTQTMWLTPFWLVFLAYFSLMSKVKRTICSSSGSRDVTEEYFTEGAKFCTKATVLWQTPRATTEASAGSGLVCKRPWTFQQNNKLYFYCTFQNTFAKSFTPDAMWKTIKHKE